jgi:hypothetical protein
MKKGLVQNRSCFLLSTIGTSAQDTLARSSRIAHCTLLLRDGGGEEEEK